MLKYSQAVYSRMSGEARMLKYCLLLLFLLLSGFRLYAQEEDPFYKNAEIGKPVSVGTIVPDFRLRQVLNYSQSEVNLSAFSGKAILIDFWAAFCQPCLAQFPKLQRLQEKYKQDLQIITITHDSLQKTTALFENIRYQGFNLLTATRGTDNNTNDSLFLAFPHKYIPHYVWIDKNRVLKAVTGYEALNEENIALLTKGEPLSAIASKDDLTLNAIHPAMYTYQEIGLPEKMMLNDSIQGLIGYSMLTGYNKKYPPSCAVSCFGMYAERRFRTWNLPLSTMLRYAYGKTGEQIWEQEMIPVPRVFFSIKDETLLRKLTVNYTQPPDTTEDLYCYDLIIAGKGISLLMDKMKEDLYRYFGVKVVMTRRKVWCYVLSLKDSSLLKTAGGETSISGNMYFLKLRNASFAKLVDHVRIYNEGSKTVPYKGLESGIIVDETKFSAKIDIDLAARMNNIPALRQALNNYGLDLQEGERWVDILLLED